MYACHVCRMPKTCKTVCSKEHQDPLHLPFCHEVRDRQPSRETLQAYFAGRRFLRGRLDDAVYRGLAIGEEFQQPFVWLAVTNKGAGQVNAAAIRILSDKMHVSMSTMGEHSFRSDPRLEGGGDACLYEGAMVRFTRNLEKTRGVVNGAVGRVEKYLERGICTVKLMSSGSRVLVHPMYDKKFGYFVPCVQGYATTIRRAQGMSLHCGCVYFDHSYPPDPGYGYVAISRFRTRAGCFLYGRIRQTDFIPVGANADTACMIRGRLSRSDDDGSDSELSHDEGQDSDVYSHGSAHYDDWSEGGFDVEADPEDFWQGYEGGERDAALDGALLGLIQ